jgi:hypothetical protein
MSLILSYNVNVETIESTGTNPTAYSQVSNGIIIQSNNNSIENCKSAKLPYTLGANQIKTISLKDLGLKYLKVLSVKSTNIVRVVKGNVVIEGSNIFVESKIPTTLPTTVSENSISILNISSEIVQLQLMLVYLD